METKNIIISEEELNQFDVPQFASKLSKQTDDEEIIDTKLSGALAEMESRGFLLTEGQYVDLI